MHELKRGQWHLARRRVRVLAEEPRVVVRRLFHANVLGIQPSELAVGPHLAKLLKGNGARHPWLLPDDTGADCVVGSRVAGELDLSGGACQLAKAVALELHAARLAQPLDRARDDRGPLSDRALIRGVDRHENRGARATRESRTIVWLAPHPLHSIDRLVVHVSSCNSKPSSASVRAAISAIEFTKSRPYRKNDQAWVEQKNGAVVRRLVGYRRLEGIAAIEALARLYGASRLFVNFFQTSFKLAEKTRNGVRVSKRYHAPATPCVRLLASNAIADVTKERLHAVLATLDPLRLLDEIRTVQHHLAGLASGEVLHILPHRDADLDSFLKSLAVAWRDGEVRPTHRTGPKPARHWRTRADPLQAVWPRVVIWLEKEPDRTAKELLGRLTADDPKITTGQLRTLQRRIREWRRLMARRLLFTPGESNAVAAPLKPSTLAATIQ